MSASAAEGGADRAALEVRAWTRRPLKRFENGALGDAVAGVEVGRIRVERRDRRQRVRQVVDDDDEVGFHERCDRHADRIAAGIGTVGSNALTAS